MADTPAVAQEPLSTGEPLPHSGGVDASFALAGQSLSEATRLAAGEQAAPHADSAEPMSTEPGVPAEAASTSAATRVLQDALGVAPKASDAEGQEVKTVEDTTKTNPLNPNSEVLKSAAREAARAAARERKRKSRMNLIVREKEKARDRVYKQNARKALKGEKLEAYRRKDRERKRLKRLQKTAAANAAALSSGVGPAVDPLSAAGVSVGVPVPPTGGSIPGTIKQVPQASAISASSAVSMAAAGLARVRQAHSSNETPGDESNLTAATAATEKAVEAVQTRPRRGASEAPAAASLTSQPPAEI